MAELRELQKDFVGVGEVKELIDADYSQIELRILAHLSGDKNMQDIFNNVGVLFPHLTDYTIHVEAFLYLLTR